MTAAVVAMATAMAATKKNKTKIKYTAMAPD
jgi:hypothetical protein